MKLIIGQLSDRFSAHEWKRNGRPDYFVNDCERLIRLFLLKGGNVVKDILFLNPIYNGGILFVKRISFLDLRSFRCLPEL